MIKIILLISLFFLVNCSFTKIDFWTKDEKIESIDKNLITVFEKKEVLKKEFNSNVRLKLSKFNKRNFKKSYLTNDLGIYEINKEIKSQSKFKFKKIKNFNYFEPEISFDGKNFIFFDDKGNILKFDENFKLLWKKNYYSKQEKKLNPILTLANNGDTLVVFDNIGKFYAVNLNTGNLLWSKTNFNPFNSQIKISKNKIVAIDLNNILRCFSLKDGSELWKFNSENTFLKSTKINSIVIKDDNVIFNNSIGDVISVDLDTGSLIWQTPTQSSEIYENAFSLVMSDLVIRKNNLVFSNNRNEFFSMNSENGLINWKQEINSNVRPVFYDKFLFTVSNEGYFFVIERMTGNIVRITDVFNVFKPKKRESIKPIGFVLSYDKMFLSTNKGRLLTINIASGKTESLSKIDKHRISKPFVFNKKILLVKDNSIIRLN